MAQVNAYLTFNGNCEAAFDFYKSVFGGEFHRVARFKDLPPMEGAQFPEDAKERIMHIALPISKETILFGGDANPMYGTVTMGQNISLSITAENREEADKLFNGLAEDGKITMPIADMFWGAYFGMLIDKFGMTWLVSFEQRQA